jgi:hypothetical protein
MPSLKALTILLQLFPSTPVPLPYSPYCVKFILLFLKE